MVNKNSSILNNDFYIFILILLLIIMLFMLSPKNKDSFNLDISKIKLNIKEPFQFNFTGDHFKFDNTDAGSGNIYLILSRYMDNLPHIKKNDIIKFYNANKTYYFKIDNVEYLTNKNYKLKIQPTDYNSKVENRVNLKGEEELLPELIGSDTNRDYEVIVVGNTNENCILATGLDLISDSNSEIDYDYDLVFSSDIEQFKDLIKIFNEGDVIELIPSDNKKTEELNKKNQFLINKIDKDNKTLKLNNSKTIANTDGYSKKILVDKEFLIKKVDLNDIVEKYHNDQKTHYHYTQHLRIKNEAINLGIMVDRIKEQMNRNK